MKTDKGREKKKIYRRWRTVLLIVSAFVLGLAVMAVILMRKKETPPIEEEIVEVVTWPAGISPTTLYQLEYSVDSYEKKAIFSYHGGADDLYHLYLKNPDGSLNLICTTHYVKDRGIEEGGISDLRGHKGGVQISVSFGENGDFDIPSIGETITFVMEAENASDLLPKGETVAKAVTLSYRDFLDMDIEAEFSELGDNRYRLCWNETGASGYRVEMKKQTEDNWETVAELEDYSVCEYDTGRLDSYQDYQYRVVAVSGGKEMSCSDEVSIHTGITIMYATVWPTKTLTLYETADKSKKIGSVYAEQSYCALGEENGMFLVYTPDGNGYIDSNYCMINLPDYLGNLCDYNITNSYYSNYMAHNYEIPGVSGMVTAGYENVLLADGTFLVPLLYPVTQKLITAAEKAREDGYVIKIYDSFRPYVATRSIYDITAKQLDDPIPDKEMQRLELNDYLLLKNAGLLPVTQGGTDEYGTMEEIAEKEAESTGETEKNTDDVTIAQEEDSSEDETMSPGDTEGSDKGSVSENEAVSDNAVTEVKPVIQIMTYCRMMMGSKYPLQVFLAQNGSRHNLGVAMDLTLERADTGEEIEMQTRMHDLSQYSVLQENNDMANLLGSYMLGSGFTGLYSEWWHFQDNDAKDDLNPVSVKNGVSVEGWKVDSRGVRYRLADGTYQEGLYQTDGKEYMFDEDGYLVENK